MMKQNTFSQKETQIAGLVRTTIQAATQPAPGQLQRLMPPPPAPKQAAVRFPFALTWQRQWVTFAFCLCLVLVGLGVYLGYPAAGGSIPSSPTFLAVTATTTSEPTSTIAHEAKERLPAETAVATQPAAKPPLVATPAPNPTPIAALVPSISSN